MGKLKNSADGYIMMDVIIALLILNVSIAGMYGIIYRAVNATAVQHKRVINTIEKQNEEIFENKIWFVKTL